MDGQRPKPTTSGRNTPTPSIITSAAPSTLTPTSLESAFSSLQTHPTEFHRAAGRGAQMLLEDWQVFVAKSKLSNPALFTDTPSGNLAALCFPLVQYPDEMEAIAYVLEYCLRQNGLPLESKLAMDATVEALSKGEFCGSDIKRITHMRGLHRFQLIVADRAKLTRPMLVRGQTFTERDQAIAMADMSPGTPVRPDRVLRNVVRLFRLNTGMPNAQAWQECWNGCVRSMVLTGNILTENNARTGEAKKPFLKKLMMRLRSSSRSGRQKLLSVPGSTTTLSPTQDLEGTNGKFAAAKERLAEREENGKAVALLDRWEALAKGHYVWGKDATVYKEWTGPRETVPVIATQSTNQRKSLMPSLQSAANVVSLLPSPATLGHGDAHSLRRLSKGAKSMLNDEF